MTFEEAIALIERIKGQVVFNSEQLEALRHHFPNISKAMEEGKDLLNAEAGF